MDAARLNRENTRTRINRFCKPYGLVGFLVPPVLVALNFAFVDPENAPYWIELANTLLWPLAGYWGFFFVESGDQWEPSVIFALVFCMILNAAYFWVLGAIIFRIPSLWQR
jgi:hypothetical protein